MTTINNTNVNVIVTTARALFDERVQFEEAMMARTNVSVQRAPPSKHSNPL